MPRDSPSLAVPGCCPSCRSHPRFVCRRPSSCCTPPLRFIDRPMHDSPTTPACALQRRRIQRVSEFDRTELTLADRRLIAKIPPQPRGGPETTTRVGSHLLRPRRPPAAGPRPVASAPGLRTIRIVPTRGAGQADMDVWSTRKSRCLGSIACLAAAVLAACAGCSTYLGTTPKSFLRHVRSNPDPNIRYIAYAKLGSPDFYDDPADKSEAVETLVAKLDEGREPTGDQGRDHPHAWASWATVGRGTRSRGWPIIPRLEPITQGGGVPGTGEGREGRGCHDARAAS